MIKKILSKKYYFYCLLLSFLVLLFTSKNSFLYIFNDWVDVNAFFTVGKSMFNGVVPYRDLFEQKGLILYFIYGIGYLLFHKGFYGVFILEVISFSFFLYYIHKTLSLYLNKKYSLIILPILTFLITTSLAFVHGGSCEEFCLPFFGVSLYYYFKHFKVSKLTNKEVIINGIMAGIIMMMKYTSLGFWIGFGLFIFIDYLRNKEIKNAFKFCLWFIIGMLIPVLLCFIYLLLNNALMDYIDCYFIFNMTKYNSGVNISFIRNIRELINGAYGSLLKNGIILTTLISLVPIFIFNISKERNSKYFRFSLLGILGMTTLVLFWGLKFMTYYLLPIYVFLTIAFLSIFILLSRFLDKFLNKKYLFIIVIFINVLFVFLSYNNANYKSMIGSSKKDFFQFKYADYINKYKNPTLLNMGFLDGGLYTTTGIIPNTRFFEVQNIDYSVYPDNIDDMKDNVMNKRVKFILFYTRLDLDGVKNDDPYIFDNYELVYDDQHYFEYGYFNAFLFKLKDLK